MKVLAALALLVVLLPETARGANFEIIPGYSDPGTDLSYQMWTARLHDNANRRVFSCSAHWDARDADHSKWRFFAYCNQFTDWQSKLPASSNVKTTYNVQKYQADHTVVAWQIDEVTGKAQVCFPGSIGINGDNCIDITPP
ncbi:hypothetical protein [Bradyrhizobium lablabi]|uniref:hypothetical protein n=1 Tax=Bradyrhizobium lablabi TaxID=722472 RepID=UPI001BAAB1D6|nr:hypothetical protein [Bradyrhizobium lablabi]MBR0698254.1 hypothetical protein [Bradyrhizobium lablabi]